MKTQKYVIAFIAVMSATGVSAENFNNLQMSFTATAGNAYATVDASRDQGIESFEGGINVFNYSLGESSQVSTTVYTGYARREEELTFGVNTAAQNSYANLAVYGGVSAEYATSVNSFRNGEFFVTPEVGASYSLTDTLSVYGNVDYTFNASDSFARNGGATELGVNYAVTNQWTMSPYITRSFDTDADSSQLGIRVGYNF